MLVKIAWRNIWRNPWRSMLIAASIALGLWAGMFSTSFSLGLYQGHVQNVIESQISHIQIHNPDFGDDRAPEFTIANGLEVAATLKKDPLIKGVSARIITNGMITSTVTAAGVLIAGIVPEDEKQISTIHQYLISGHYLDNKKKNEIIIGEKLAIKLQVKLHHKIVLNFQSKQGDITAGSFRVAGIFRSRNSTFDENTVFTRRNELADLLGTENEVHEIAILLNDDKAAEANTKRLRKQFPALQIQSWKEISPELRFVVDSFYEYMYIFIAIILLALMFGIVNTMLMAVLERQREIGILMAIGLNRRRLFSMIVMETIFLVIIGIPVGLALTEFSVNYFGNHGIDISAFSKGLAMYGFSNRVYPHIDPTFYLPVILMTTGAAIISAIYPARRALKMKPAEAIRKI